MLDRNYFPQYGRVAIIDDHREEVEGLMTLLSMNAIPYIYLERVSEEFSQLNSEGYRIVFLDLVLSGSTDEKTVKSLLIANLNGLLKENNGPCTIAIWSTKVEHYQEQLKEVLTEINCKSCEVIYLDKMKYKDYGPELIGDFEDHFADKFKNSTVLQYISLWENETNNCMINITNQIMSLLPVTRRDKGGHYASNLARLVLGGRINDPNLNNHQKLLSSYEGLNTLLNKECNLSLENIVTKADSLITVGFPEPKPSTVKINTLLWLGKPYTYHYPKNVYKINEINCTLTRAFTASNVNDDDNIYVIIDITNKCNYVNSISSKRGHQFLYGILFARKIMVRMVNSRFMFI